MENGIRMSLRLIIVMLILHIQQIESRYCQEAVDSVKKVTSCPTSEAEWDDAARRKGCSSIASTQNCTRVDKFQYHCVINEYRNELLEVCAPLRYIIGHCVEFNVAGGVIQDQFSAPCKETFPKCDFVYPSRNAYKYPDCYQLVFNNKMSSTNNEIISTTSSTTEKKTNSTSIHEFKSNNYILIIPSMFACVLLLLTLLTLLIRIRRSTQLGRKLASIFTYKDQNIESNSTESISLMQICEEQYEDASDAGSDDPVVLQQNSDQRKDASDNQSEELSSVQSDSDNMCDPELPSSNISPPPSSIQTASSCSTIYNMCHPEVPTRNISPAQSSIQPASSGSTIYFTDEDASDARSNGPDVLQPYSDQRKDASDNQSEELSTVQSDSDNMCDTELPTPNISPAPGSIQSASSGPTIYEDASDAKSDDPTVLQPSSDDTQEEHQLENGSPVMKEEMP